MVAKKRFPLKRLVPVAVILILVIASLVYVQQQRKPREIVLAGTLEARTVNVGSLVGGRVTAVHVDEGVQVTAEQPLVTLETDTIDRQISEQRAAIAAAQAEYSKALAGPRQGEIEKAAAVAANAEREHRRMAALFRDGIVARQVLDDAATAARTAAEDLDLLRKGTRQEEIALARAALQRQEAQLNVLMKQRAETVVKAPAAGLVQSFELRPGDIVAPNQTVAEILESDQLWVRVYVPETLLGLVHTGQAVKVRVDTFPDQWFNGAVATVASEGEYTPRNIQTRAQRAEQVFAVKVLVERNPKLKAGMAAEVDLGVKGRA